MGGGEHPPTKVLVIGGSYAGLAATTTLLDLCRGKMSTGSISPDGLDTKSRLPINITLVDERDGFCTYMSAISSPQWI
jgi:hypothetical protein